MPDQRLLSIAGRWFDLNWYNARNPDVVRAGIDPLAHYVRYGEAEGRFPSPWFNPAWYRAAYGIASGQSAIEHFLENRASGQFLPCAELYLVAHSRPWRAMIGAGGDPFDHYLTAKDLPERELIPDLRLIEASGLIDAGYYRINPVDQYEAELAPALHFCRFGWWRGLRPSTAFDRDWYGETNHDVERLGINPLTHYILEGEAANRRPVPWFDPAWYRSAYDVPPDQLALAHYILYRGTRTVSPNPLFDIEWYIARHGASIPSGADPFSHYLLHGALSDIDPSPGFDAKQWRHRHMASIATEGQSEQPASARNPLVHHLRLMLAAS